MSILFTPLTRAACAAAALATIALAAAAQDRLVVSVVNRTATNWALYAGAAQEVFSGERLTVDVQYAGSSEALTAALLRGEVHVGHMAAGNVIQAVRRGQDLTIVMGVNRPVFTFVVRAGIRGPEGLRGARVGVDNLRTGYVHLVRRYLAAHGLTTGDVILRDVGGVDERYRALLAGEIDAALLSAPRDLEAAERGFTALAELDEAPQHYTGSVAVVRRSWARANGGLLVRYLRAYARSVDWLYDGRNLDAAARLLADALALDLGRARNVYTGAIARRRWLVPDGAVHPGGLRAVAEQTTGGSGGPPFRFEDYVDLSWLRAARADRRSHPGKRRSASEF